MASDRHPGPVSAGSATCARCENRVTAGARFCAYCGAPQADARNGPLGAPPAPAYPPLPGEKSPGLAAALSVITGLGQMYNREVQKGAVFMLVGAILVLLVARLAAGLCAIWLPFWIYGVVDAWARADAYNRALRATGRPPW